MGIPLKWSETAENVYEASAGKRRFVVHRREDSTGWTVEYFLHPDEPRGKNGDYHDNTLEGAQKLAQTLTDQP